MIIAEKRGETPWGTAKRGKLPVGGLLFETAEAVEAPWLMSVEVPRCGIGEGRCGSENGGSVFWVGGTAAIPRGELGLSEGRKHRGLH